MQTFFADAWFFIALIDRRDSHHQRAQVLAARLTGHALFTHDAVLTEVLAYFADEGAHLRKTAADYIRTVLLRYEVVAGDRRLFLAALDLYAARPDKEYSLVDCMSMVVMEAQRIQHVLTNDHHFTQAGFIVVSQ